MTTAIIVLYAVLALILLQIMRLTSRQGQHEDLMLDLRLLINDLNETLEKRRTVTIDLPKQDVFTREQIEKFQEEFNRADDR